MYKFLKCFNIGNNYRYEQRNNSTRFQGDQPREWIYKQSYLHLLNAFKKLYARKTQNFSHLYNILHIVRFKNPEKKNRNNFSWNTLFHCITFFILCIYTKFLYSVYSHVAAITQRSKQNDNSNLYSKKQSLFPNISYF